MEKNFGSGLNKVGKVIAPVLVWWQHFPDSVNVLKVVLGRVRDNVRWLMTCLNGLHSVE